MSILRSGEYESFASARHSSSSMARSFGGALVRDFVVARLSGVEQSAHQRADCLSRRDGKRELVCDQRKLRCAVYQQYTAADSRVLRAVLLAAGRCLQFAGLFLAR